MTGAARILIVGTDQEAIRELTDILTPGYSVEAVFSSAQEALDAVAATQPDLILMESPSMGAGPVTDSEAAKIFLARNIPVIYLTEADSAACRNPAGDMQQYGVVKKPYDPRSVTTSIELALHKHAITQTQSFLGAYRFIAQYASSWEMWCDPLERPLYISPSCERITGYTASEIIRNPSILSDMVFSEDCLSYHGHQEAIRKATSQEFSLDFRIVTKPGEIKWIHHSCIPIFNDSHVLQGRRVSNFDVTDEREKNQEYLRMFLESQQRYFTMAESMKDTAVFVYDEVNGFEYINTSGASWFGTRPDEIQHRTISELMDEDTRNKIRAMLDYVYSQGKPCYFEESFSAGPEKNLDLEIWLFTMGTQKNDPIKVWGLAHNVTEKKKAEKKIVESLQEKEILLKEIHHRVKNNLQQIASLLYLQEKRGNNPDAVATLQESRNRVFSMSLAHEVLYSSDNLSKVKLAAYIRQLAGYLRNSYGLLSRDITIRTEIDPDISLPLDECITCGIIINELVSNSMKYAFDSGTPGEIFIAFHAGEGEYTLIIGDDGRGIPDSVSFKEPKKLGHSLVANLVRQLNGTITLSCQAGTVFTIKFPIRNSSNSGQGSSKSVS